MLFKIVIQVCMVGPVTQSSLASKRALICSQLNEKTSHPFLVLVSDYRWISN